MRFHLLAPAIVFVLAGATLNAQSLEAGAPVRVWADFPPLVRQRLTVHQVHGDTITLGRDHRSATEAFRLPLSAIKRIELEVPRSRLRGAGRGAAKGAIIGLAVGAGLGVVALVQNKTNEGGPDPERAMIFAPPLAMTFGVLVGTQLGAIYPGKQWRCAPRLPCG